MNNHEQHSNDENVHAAQLAKEFCQLASDPQTEKIVRAGLVALAGCFRVPVREIALDAVLFRGLKPAALAEVDAFGLVLSVEEQLGCVMPDRTVEKLSRLRDRTVREWLDDLIDVVVQSRSLPK